MPFSIGAKEDFKKGTFKKRSERSEGVNHMHIYPCRGNSNCIPLAMWMQGVKSHCWPHHWGCEDSYKTSGFHSETGSHWRPSRQGLTQPDFYNRSINFSCLFPSKPYSVPRPLQLQLICFLLSQIFSSFLNSPKPEGPSHFLTSAGWKGTLQRDCCWKDRETRS